METTFPIETKHPDGVHTLPKGTQVHVRNSRAMEIWAPHGRDSYGSGARAQDAAEEEAGAFLGVEIGPGFWRIDRVWYVLTFPRAIRRPEAA